jgi:GDP-L-fucose synthase
VSKKVLITGGTGMVGSALRQLIPDGLFVSSADCDLRIKEKVFRLYEKHEPTHIIHLAAKVGGIAANSNYLADFYTDNIEINTNVLAAANHYGVQKVISLLSTCIYPDNATYPLTEDQIHDGPPHASNYAYAYAKRMLEVQSRSYRDQHGRNYITVVPNNLYGENDNFHIEDSHVIPALMRKIHEAKISDIPSVTLWGDGTPLREFTYSKDLSKILLFLLDNYNLPEPLNVGNTNEVSISNIAQILKDIIGYSGAINWDVSKPKGQLRKPSDNSNLISIGWDPSRYTEIRKGLQNTYDWYIMNYPNVRGVE